MKQTQEERAGKLARSILSVGDKTLEDVFATELPNFSSHPVKIAFVNEDDNLTLRLIINENATGLLLAVEDYYDNGGLRPIMVQGAMVLVGAAVQYLIAADEI